MSWLRAWAMAFSVASTRKGPAPARARSALMSASISPLASVRPRLAGALGRTARCWGRCPRVFGLPGLRSIALMFWYGLDAAEVGRLAAAVVLPVRMTHTVTATSRERMEVESFLICHVVQCRAELRGGVRGRTIGKPTKSSGERRKGPL